MSQIDPRFLQARRNAARRHKHKRLGAVALGLAALALAAGIGGGWWFWSRVSPDPVPDLAADLSPEPGLDLVSNPGARLPDSDLAALSGLAPEDPPALRPSLDLPGDPLLLRLGTSAPGATRRLPRPAELPATRGEGDILALRGPLLPPGERLSVALPSSQEDFAIFQAQRHQSSRGAAVASVTTAQGRGGEAVYRPPGSAAEARGLLAAHDPAANPGQIGANALRLRPAETRQRPWQDSILRIERDSDLAALLRHEGVDEAESARIALAAQEVLGVRQLARGQILALRQSRDSAGTWRFAQLALYEGMRYLGALARQDPLPEAFAGAFAAAFAGALPETGTDIGTASDPWLHQDLPALIDDPLGTDTGTGPGSAPRVMDALYAAGLRHGLPPGLVGQIIMLLAQTHRLDAEAGPDDSMTLLYSAAPQSPGTPGAAQDMDQVLYIALQSGDSQMQCHVFRPGPDRPPACYGPQRGSGPPAASPSTSPATPPAPGSTQSLTGGDAVEQLVNRIIQIESAGRADARNPNSSATGLGQFIDSTWLRMMRVYRPDLVARLSRQELLALRTEPDISREMVLNLAREGESYLRARGHEITAGRLYLAHFLGMEGAHIALSAAPEADLQSLYGAAVINANDFLRGHNAGYVVNWAESRMRGASGRIAVIREPEGLATFRVMIDSLLTAL